MSYGEPTLGPLPWNTSHTHTTGPTYTYANGGCTTYPLIIDGQWTPTKETPPMSTAQKIADERKEKRERERLDRLYAAWDEYPLDDALPNTTDAVGFTIHDGETEYHYVVMRLPDVKDRARWLLAGTGASRLIGSTTEDLLAWFVEHDFTPDGLPE